MNYGKYAMQYRTRQSETSEWNEWSWLPAQLIFMHYYIPQIIEFRYHPWEPSIEPTFKATTVWESQ